MTAETIAARRKHIQDSAPCEGCGATLAGCRAQRGKDPTAPEWFGCCARGLDLSIPCNHVPDQRALLALLREIESGSVRPVEEVKAPAQARSGMSWHDYLDQSERWKPDGKPMVAIADMDPAWRHNAARWLERHAAAFAIKYGLSEAAWFAVQCASPMGPSEVSRDGIERDMEQRAAERDRDPVAWIRTTALYRALVAGLPSGEERKRLAERAKHWSTCPGRAGEEGCRCEEISAEHGLRRALDAGMPEWTSS